MVVVSYRRPRSGGPSGPKSVDVGGWPPGGVPHGSVRIGIQPQPQRVGPGEPSIQKAAQQLVARETNVARWTCSVDQPARAQFGLRLAEADADAEVG